jgi:PII-like signaling protein
MKEEFLQLSIFVDETDTSGDQPLYEAIVRRLLHLDIAGATAMRGEMGYGRHARVHSKRLFGVADDRPIVILAIDHADKIRNVLPEIRSLMQDGLMTLSPVDRVS